MKHPKAQSAQPDHHNMFLAASVVFITLILLTIMNARLARQYPEKPTVLVGSITPISMPRGVAGWKTFSHPSYKFTFQYPQSWNVALTKSNKRDREYALVLIYQVAGRDYRIDFMRGGRGAVDFDSIKRDTRDFGGKTGYKNTYIKDGVAKEEVITFRDMNIIAPYIAINAQLPPTKTDEYIATIDRLTSSIVRQK